MSATPRPPQGLGEVGRRLWRSVHRDLPDDLKFDARELELLRRACRTADELQALEAVVDRGGYTAVGSAGQTVIHPAVAEARQLRLVMLRLLGALDLGDGSASERKARTAAHSRWALRRAG